MYEAQTYVEHIIICFYIEHVIHKQTYRIQVECGAQEKNIWNRSEGGEKVENKEIKSLRNML